MATKFKDFLLNYFKQRRFNTMPDGARMSFQDYVKNGDFSGHMKSWRDHLMTKDDNEPCGYRQKDLPNPFIEFDDNEWTKLYHAFESAFRRMDSVQSKGDVKFNHETTEFLNKYFGPESYKLFSHAQIAPRSKEAAEIEKLKALLKDAPAPLRIMLKRNGIINDADFTFDDFKNGIEGEKYNDSPEFQDKLKDFASAWNYEFDNDPEAFERHFAGVSDIPRFPNLENAFAPSEIKPDILKRFKVHYKDLLDSLQDEPKIFETFKQYDHSPISQSLDQAKKDVDYDNKESDDFVQEKRDDEFTPYQQIQRWLVKGYKNNLEKYVKLSGDRIFFSPAAKTIVDAFDKVDLGEGKHITPTGGIDQILSNKDKVEALLGKSPSAKKQFKWFTKTMEDLKATMPKAFAGALKNGWQMRALVSELIIKAVHEHKIEEAKTAMEVLTVMQFGFTTSKVMETLRQDTKGLKLFSDPELSWNQNEGVKFVTTAIDKSIRIAFLTAGYGINALGHLFKRRGRKFKDKDDTMDKRLEKEYENKSKLNYEEGHSVPDDLNKVLTEKSKKALTEEAGLKNEKDLLTDLEKKYTANQNPELKKVIENLRTDINNRGTKVGDVKNKALEAKELIETYNDEQYGIKANKRDWGEKEASEFKQLRDYWNMLQGGNVSWSFGSREKKQDKFFQAIQKIKNTKAYTPERDEAEQKANDTLRGRRMRNAFENFKNNYNMTA